MNKKLEVIISLILVLILTGIQVSYAVQNNNANGFFTVNKTEISKKETLEMTMNLNKIEYDNFKIVLNSNVNNGDIYAESNVTLGEESNAIVIEVDKTKMNINEIKLCYVVPENAETNSIIQLIAKVIVEEEIESQDEEGNTITQKQEKVILQESQNVNIIEENENQENENTDNVNQENNDAQKPDNQNQNSQNTIPENGINKIEKEDSTKNNEMAKPSSSDNNITQKNMGTPTNINKSQTSSSFKTSINVSSSISSIQGTQSIGNIETATYNGSNNNYLKSLKIKGVKLNTEFSKENTTYFASVTDTSSLKITATEEDDSAKVVITGNDNIKKGQNKILIAVTAENGDVRYYRIFVNCTAN